MNIKANLIGGEWLRSDNARANINPSDTDDVVGHYADATYADVKAAVEAARAAAEPWAQAPLGTRATLLQKVADAIDAKRSELALLLSREEGKALRDATAEIVRSAEIFRFYAGEVYRMSGDRVASVRQGVGVEVLYEPIGVVGLITPWNFPMVIPAWKIAPALAYGNAVLFKPSELVPGTAWALTEIIHTAGAPAGLFNLLMGGGEIGKAIVDHVDAVSFTGSVPTGRAVAQQAAGRMIPAQCELGGKNPLIIAADADLAVAVDCAVQGSFFQTGQRCTASSRLVVDQEIVSRFTDALVERLKSVVVGEGPNAATDIGPVADDRQFAKDLSYIALAEKEGARRIYGGEQLNQSKSGYYLSPALFTESSNAMRINREEVFGPVACIIPVRGYEEALHVANDTDFGLSAGIVTTSLKLAHNFKAKIHSGISMVNLPTAGVDFHVPLSGMKASSYGQPEMGSQAMRFYTKARTAYTFPG
jgi:acyl-CoA reductase-like NAD-dependent aldehyde dehydrogenase